MQSKTQEQNTRNQKPKTNTQHPTLSSHLQFLITCCQAEPDLETIGALIEDGKWKTEDGEELISMAARHGILPLVYKTLQQFNSSQLPITNYQLHERLLADFQSAYMQIVRRNMLMSAELLRIMKLLETNDIKALAFKGPALAQMAYGNITLRQYGDLDILIKKEDRARAMAVLEEASYTPEIVLGEKTKETFFNAVNVIGYYKKENGILVEVHWELLAKNYAISWDASSLWEDTASVRINQSEIPVLSTEQLLLYLCIHGSKHLFERLEWVVDIDRTIRAHSSLKWEAVFQQAKALGIERMLMLGLSLSHSLLNTPLPDTVMQKINRDRHVPDLMKKIVQTSFSHTSNGKSYGTFGLLLQMRERLSDKLLFVWRAMLSPKFDDFRFIQLPKHLAFLYPLIRPYRLITKYMHHKP